MNKIIKAISIFCLIVIAGCSQDVITIPEQQIEDGKDVTVSFTTSIPEFKTITTRANGGVNNMYLLVFDENGNFITRQSATLTEQTTTGGKFTAKLPPSSSTRIIHFISNLNDNEFNDTPGMNEAAVVALLSTSEATFWSRVALSTGISANSFTGRTVELLRNQAKISVVNEAANFTTNGFVIHNAPDKGTVAPYSTTNGFVERTITEPAGVTLLQAVQANFSTTEKHLFERKNASASAITTVIVRGTYEGQSYFYKIDLIDADKDRYDIERNYHYIVKIKTVTRAGYTSFSDALEGASHNNTALDPVIERYPMISDGVSKLEVEKTLVILTQPNQPFQVWAKYFPELDSETFNNDEVTVTLQTGNTAIVGTSLQFNKATGIITGTGLGTLPEEPGVALIRVSKGDLARTIRIQLREPFEFNPVTINNASPATLNGTQSQTADLRFNIPADFPDDLFPLPIKIYSQGLYPAETGLEMVVESGQIHYIYRATQKGVQLVKFKTNSSGNAESVILQADYFLDGMVGYNVTTKTGNITYGTGNTPVPYAWRNNLYASTGTINLTENGKYSWSYHTSFGNQNQTVTLDVFEGLLHTRYTRSNVTPSSVTNIHLNTANIIAINGGTITHGGPNMSVIAGTGVPSNAIITATTGTITVTGTGQFKYQLPASYNNNTDVTFTYTKQVNSNHSEVYTQTMRVTDLISSGTITLSPKEFVYTGTLRWFRNNNNQGNINTNQTVTISPAITSSTFTRPSNGYYMLVVPATISANEMSIDRTFTYQNWGGTYTLIRSLNDMKENYNLELRN